MALASRNPTAAKPLMDYISARVAKADLTRGEWIGTEVDLAQRFGISRMTVRRALDPWVNRGVIKRQRGQGLFLGRAHLASQVIQLVVPNLLQEEMTRVLVGARRRVAEEDFQVQILDAHGDTEEVLTFLRDLPHGRARGAILRSLHDGRFIPAMLDFHRIGFPFVLIDQTLPELPISTVTADNYGGGAEIGRLLIKRGHRRIAFLANTQAQTNQDRLAGLAQVMSEAGITFDPAWLVNICTDDPLGDWEPMVERAVARLLAEPAASRPTVVLCNDDRAAALVIRQLYHRGVRVPEDLSVIGAGNMSLGHFLPTRLTSLDSHHEQQGFVAMDILLRAIEADKRGESLVDRHVLPMSICHRDSVAQVDQ